MDTKESGREFVERWKRVGPLLEKIREEDIRRSDTERDIEAFDDVLEYALSTFPPKPESGMVEMQRLFMRFNKQLQQVDKEPGA